ncbi:hypothetical protein ABH940_004277 [Streptacidiphilus sp. BW17]
MEPQSLTTASEFVGALRDLKAVSGLSLRELQRLSGLPRSTIAHALDAKRATLPPWERVAALLPACGVPEASLPSWQRAWARIVLGANPSPVPALGETDTPGDAAEPGPVGDADLPPAGHPAADLGVRPPSGDATGSRLGAAAVPGARLTRLRGAFRRRGVRSALLVLTHGVALAVGITLGIAHGIAHGVPVARPQSGVQIGYPVEEQVCPSLPAGQSPVTGPEVGSPTPSGQLPSWVGRATSDAQILSGTDVVLPILNPVKAGDSLVVSIMLTATCPGRVTVTDSQGDAYNVVGDETDSSHHRTLVIAAFHVHALGTADSIHVVYPHASKYHVAVDEYRGISAATGHAQAYGESGHTAFSTDSVQLDCTAGELLVGAVGANTGSEPDFTAEWHQLPELKLSSYRLSTAYRVVPAAQSCAATGTTTAQWAAVAVAFR